MSDLNIFRDHCREMASAEHMASCHASLPTRWGYLKRVVPDPACAGCVTDTERVMWARLADEIDVYLAEPEDEGLFE